MRTSTWSWAREDAKAASGSGVIPEPWPRREFSRPKAGDRSAARRAVPYAQLTTMTDAASDVGSTHELDELRARQDAVANVLFAMTKAGLRLQPIHLRLLRAQRGFAGPSKPSSG